MSKLDKEQQEVWDRLNHVPERGVMFSDCDVNSMYASAMTKAIDRVFLVNRVSGDEDSVKMRTIKVLKSR